MYYRFIKVALICLLVLGCASVVYDFLAPMRPVLPHRGDGTFQDLSRRVGGVPVYGYSITLPEFDLGASYQAEFSMSGLQDIRRRCVVCLATKDPFDRWTGRWPANRSLTPRRQSPKTKNKEI